MSKRIKVEFELDLPVEASREEIEEWLKFELTGGAITGSNPLYEYCVVADYMSLKYKPA